jgi:hypothetical protein
MAAIHVAKPVGLAPCHERRACRLPRRVWKATADRGGQQPAEPFRIVGNRYYVGANDVTSFLITGPAGHIVLTIREIAPISPTSHTMLTER